ncbi:MAG: site-specific integrase [Firmicutes bacterium]|nr:site-specific integrase [Bacillota bacterium]
MAQIRRRGPNNYTIIIYLGRKENGKKDCYSETFYGERREANMRAAELELQFKRRSGPKKAAMTLGNYLDKWLNGISDNVTPRTHEKYSWHVQRLKPLVGDLQLSKLDVLDVKECLKPLNSDVAPRTRKDLYSTLRSAMRQAVDWGILLINPLAGLKTPRMQKKEMNVLNLAEVEQFLEAAKAYKHYPVIRVLAVTGLRLGEVLGLKWDDIDFVKCTLTVQRAADCRRRILKEETKTESSRRTIELDQETLSVLAAHRETQKKEKAVPFRKRDGLVFHSQDGRPLREGAIRITKNRILKKSGLRHIRLHDLRHSVATIKLNAGESLISVAGLLGHANPSTTVKTYAHPVRGGRGLTPKT